MIKFTTQELEMEKSLKQRIEFICEFCHVTPTITNGSIKKINNTNLNYIEPHKIVVNNTTFLAFNYSTDIYIGNLNKKIKLVELEDYIKNMANVNDTIRMYKKGKIKMYKIVHDISPRVHSFVILWSEDWR